MEITWALNTFILYQSNCEECDKKSSTRQGPRLHKGSVHERILHSCNKCEHKAIQKPNLNRHIGIKWGDRIEECVMMEILMCKLGSCVVVWVGEIPSKDELKYKICNM